MNRALFTHFSTFTIQKINMFVLGNTTILSIVYFIGLNIMYFFMYLEKKTQCFINEVSN